VIRGPLLLEFLVDDSHKPIESLIQ